MDAPGTTQPSAPQASQIQTRPPSVTFNPQSVPPSQYLYFQDNDLLQFNVLTNTSTTVITVRYRYLTPQGEIKEGTLLLQMLGQLLQFFQFPVSECWILSIGLQITSTNPNDGWAFVQVVTSRGLPALGISNSYGTIWEGYVVNGTAVGWPGTPSQRVIDGPGTIRFISGTTPGAGADINEVVPSNRRWVLLAFRASLTTSAAVANRTPTFLYMHGANILTQTPNSILQAASTTLSYNIGPIGIAAAPTAGDIILPLNPPILLKTVFTFRTSTTNLQAGDQWTAPSYVVQEWGIWDQ